jgi:hypothetical protein
VTQDMTLAIQVTGTGLTSEERIATTPPETFGSKFRAITRAITHGQSGVITVNGGRSQRRKPISWKHKLAGHGLMTCEFGGGQGRGRTADLPIFSRSCRTDTRRWSRQPRTPGPRPPWSSSNRTSLAPANRLEHPALHQGDDGPIDRRQSGGPWTRVAGNQYTIVAPDRSREIGGLNSGSVVSPHTFVVQALGPACRCL